MSPRRQLALLWGGVAAALVALSPLATRLATGLPACPVRSWLDLPCLTCGTTRAALALARFDPAAALAWSPLATVAWILLIGGGLAVGGMAVVDRPLPAARVRPTRSLRLALALLLLANWAYLVLAGV